MSRRSHLIAALRQVARYDDEREALQAVKPDEFIETTRTSINRAQELMQLEGFCADEYDFGVDDDGVMLSSICQRPRGHDGEHSQED